MEISLRRSVACIGAAALLVLVGCVARPSIHQEAVPGPRPSDKPIAAKAPESPAFSPPTEAMLAKADVGPKPKQSICELHARVFIKTDLRDPDSALFKFTDLKKGWYYSKHFREVRYAWVLDFMYNAKNAYGGYVGYKVGQVFFVDGNTVAERTEDDEAADGMRLLELLKFGSGRTAEQAGVTN